MRWKWLKKQKTKIWTFAGIKRGKRGEGVELMNVIHFDALQSMLFLDVKCIYFRINIDFAFATILSSHIWFYFGFVWDMLMPWKFFWKDLFLINKNLWKQHGTDALARKNAALCLRHQHQNQIFTTFCQLYNMSMTFPIKDWWFECFQQCLCWCRQRNR